MNKIIKKIPKSDDCGCGKPVKISDRQGKTNIKKIVKKRDIKFTVLSREEVENDRSTAYEYLL